MIALARSREQLPNEQTRLISKTAYLIVFQIAAFFAGQQGEAASTRGAAGLGATKSPYQVLIKQPDAALTQAIYFAKQVKPTNGAGTMSFLAQC